MDYVAQTLVVNHISQTIQVGTGESMDYRRQLLTVSQKTQKIYVDAIDKTASVVNAGPIGPPGPPGESGQVISYEHDQLVAASSWLINHNMGYKPSVAVEEAGTGDDIMCSVIHHSVNQVELQFNQPRAGTAHLT